MVFTIKTSAASRYVCALAVIVLLALSLGCGWSSAQSRNNTRTGVSESGYPGDGKVADPGSPALESMRRPEKKGMSKAETKAPDAQK